MLKTFTAGIWRENPVYVMALGLCPTLATTTSVENAIGMGLAAMFVLVCSNIMVSLFSKFFPSSIRIPCFIVVIATFVTVIDLSMKAYLPSLSNSLGLFIPLIVVNCIILARAEAFASKNGLFSSILDGVGMGLGFTLALGIIGAIREILGTGNFFGLPLSTYYNLGGAFEPPSVIIMAPGAFMVLGLLLGLFSMLKLKKISKAARTAHQQQLPFELASPKEVASPDKNEGVQ